MSGAVDPRRDDRALVERAVCTLLAWPGMTVARLRRLLARLGAIGALDALVRGDAEVHHALEGLAGAADALLGGVPAGSVGEIRRELEALQRRGAALWEAMRSASMAMWLPGDPWWQARFGDHPAQPAALFVQGTLDVLERPRVAIVGTRSATPAGREMARRLGQELSDAGVAVVSGLAFGIDAHAHAGVLASADPAPIGVVGSGLDVVYPKENAELWSRVGASGLLVSEYPPGTRPSTRTFPARNRIIAALADVVVVVESTEHGGSLLTADEAHRWRRPVMAVPGNPMHPSCAGSNRLLRERLSERAVQVCLETADVLSVLMLDRAMADDFVDPRPTPDATGTQLLDAIGWDGWTTGRLVTITGLAPGAVAAALDRLEQTGWVECRNGTWSQRAARRSPARATAHRGGRARGGAAGGAAAGGAVVGGGAGPESPAATTEPGSA